MTKTPILIWFRRDLRLQDHPALAAASGHPIIPVYIDSEEKGREGEAGLVWLHHSLLALEKNLKELGSSLLIRKGPILETLKELIKETGAKAIYCTRRYEPDTSLPDLKELKSFGGSLLFEPWTIFNNQKKPFQVFTHFWKTCLKESIRDPLSGYEIHPFNQKFPSLSVHDLELLPKVHWDRPMIKGWNFGEEAAYQNLESFIKDSLENYAITRDIPSIENGVSHLSPHLHFGEISPYQIWHTAKNHPQAEMFLRQLIWREFAAYLLFHFPYIVDMPFKPAFNAFQWEKNPVHLKAWQQGLTGYPIVDAGMRQLWQTGWMHNRVRMIVGSFLVKDLLIDWKEGAKWFWNTLVDADLANNTLGWQWIGGMGVDAAPYFRIFNPTLQGEKFDEEGAYIRKYVPELQHLPNQWIHRPFEAPPLELHQLGVVLGKTYPFPIVDHSQARLLALERFQLMKNID